MDEFGTIEDFESGHLHDSYIQRNIYTIQISPSFLNIITFISDNKHKYLPIYQVKQDSLISILIILRDLTSHCSITRRMEI